MKASQRITAAIVALTGLLIALCSIASARSYRENTNRDYSLPFGPNPFAPGEPESFYTSDPGKALVTGLCSDFNRGKGPVLRGLAARAPYFHNGSAANLQELVNFYNLRFNMQLTEEQKSELVAFLNSL